MTDIDSIKNGQRLYHIIQAGERIFRSVDGISKEDFYTNEDKQGNVVRCPIPHSPFPHYPLTPQDKTSSMGFASPLLRGTQ